MDEKTSKILSDLHARFFSYENLTRKPLGAFMDISICRKEKLTLIWVVIDYWTHNVMIMNW